MYIPGGFYLVLNHDDVIEWKNCPRYWPFVRGIHRSPVNSPHKGQRRGGLMFSLICTWINVWVNNCEAGDLRSHRAHYDVTVMSSVKNSIDQVQQSAVIISFAHNVNNEFATKYNMNIYLILNRAHNVLLGISNIFNVWDKVLSQSEKNRMFEGCCRLEPSIKVPV